MTLEQPATGGLRRDMHDPDFPSRTIMVRLRSDHGVANQYRERVRERQTLETAPGRRDLLCTSMRTVCTACINACG